jgi:hypothetical protein
VGHVDDATAGAHASFGVADAGGSEVHISGAPAILATVALRRGNLNAATAHAGGLS